mmetsp:Transcript_85557/g.135701  ORF Transcript_85557/g.135701 Transcript_85557/m.135701 type:complete len:187 (+) Transcript_85557:556-1116(+)
MCLCAIEHMLLLSWSLVSCPRPPNTPCTASTNPCSTSCGSTTFPSARMPRQLLRLWHMPVRSPQHLPVVSSCPSAPTGPTVATNYSSSAIEDTWLPGELLRLRHLPMCSSQHLPVVPWEFSTSTSASATASTSAEPITTRQSSAFQNTWLSWQLLRLWLLRMRASQHLSVVWRIFFCCCRGGKPLR